MNTISSAKPFVWTAVDEARHQSDLAKRRADAWIRASAAARDNKWGRTMTVLSSALSEQAKIKAELVSAASLVSKAVDDPRLQLDLEKLLAMVDKQHQAEARRQIELAQIETAVDDAKLHLELASLHVQSVEMQKVVDDARIQVELVQDQTEAWATQVAQPQAEPKAQAEPKQAVPKAQAEPKQAERKHAESQTNLVKVKRSWLSGMCCAVAVEK